MIDAMFYGRTIGVRFSVSLARVLFSSVAIASASASAAATATADANPSQVIPSSRCRGLWIVALTFGEEGESARTLQLVLDTGASSSSVDPDAIERVLGRRVKVGKKVTLRDGTAGPLQVRRMKVRVHEMDHLALALGFAIDGILGFDVFADLLLTLDYHDDEVRVGRGKLGPVDGRKVFADLGKGRPYIALDFGDRKVPLLLDSGSGGGLDLRSEDVKQWLVEPRPVSAAVRFSKIEVTESGRLGESPRFGPLVIERPPVEVREGTRLVGAEALERFELTFDQRSRRIRMLPDSDGPIRLPLPRGIGAALYPRAGGFEVLRVFDGLPAAEAGLRVGDVVVAIDGTPVAKLGCVRAEDDPGRTSKRLTIRRDDHELELEVGIADLLPTGQP